MASFRKSSSRTRAALEASTALPTMPSDVLDHAGEQAVKLAVEVARDADPTAKGARKGGRAVATADTGALERSVEPETLPEPTESFAATQHEPEAAPFAPVTPAEAPWQDADDVVAMTEAAQAHVAPADESPVESVEHALQAPMEPVQAAVLETREAAAIEAMHRPDPLGEIHAKVSDAMRASVEDAMSYWTALVNVRSVPEAVSLNTRHLQRRVEAFTTQSRDLALLVQKVAADAMEPFKPTVSR